MEYVSTAAIIGCYLAIIGLYIWVFKVTSELKDTMNGHFQKSETHPASSQLVYKDVCDQKVKRFEEAIGVVNTNLSEFKKAMSEEFKEVKQMIANSAK